MPGTALYPLISVWSLSIEGDVEVASGCLWSKREGPALDQPGTGFAEALRVLAPSSLSSLQATSGRLK